MKRPFERSRWVGSRLSILPPASMRRVVLLLEIFAALALAEPTTPVILISIDTLRADHLSAYGYRRIRTPHIDSFAQQGTLFTNIEAQIPLTLPSHTSLFTSTYPFENQFDENPGRVPPAQSHWHPCCGLKDTR